MYSSLAIAYAFVQKGIDDGNPVTQMKLQKLVYFANGIHLAQYGEPLIKENFESWDYGPVIPQIYQQFKIYGSSPIDDTSLFFVFNPSAKNVLDLAVLDENAKETISVTWKSLKDISAITLSAWTHKKGSPWEKHYQNGIIPNDEIKEYFKTEFVKD